ncbi:ABC transporter ATP-binding protein [Bdellovibrio sp. NC01]|uniref:ABC transporter ATP-binding protein n=1 Tax=Bdellovibrio sp. NC01 TaxID=2220073 RepID=UPI001FEFA41C|nr:ABC transporter ATP-binding protein [Bdellovibrio sp. NC01]
MKFGDFYAVKDISFSVEQGEIFGFLGANGAGKTTTIRVLCGLLIPSEGEAFVCGTRVADDPLKVKQSVGYMSQKFTLYDDMTVDENLSFAASLRKLDEQKFKENKERLLKFIRFQQSGSSMVRDLPGGVKQQMSLVAALLHDPEVVFLDEPTAGVSPAYRQRFWQLIREVAGNGKTVFVTTHYMDEAEQCGRIALMKEGQLIALDTPENLKKKNFPEKQPGEVHLEEVFIAEVEGKEQAVPS